VALKKIVISAIQTIDTIKSRLDWWQYLSNWSSKYIYFDSFLCVHGLLLLFVLWENQLRCFIQVLLLWHSIVQHVHM